MAPLNSYSILILLWETYFIITEFDFKSKFNRLEHTNGLLPINYYSIKPNTFDSSGSANSYFYYAFSFKA